MASSIYLKNKKARYVDCLNHATATANNLQTAIGILNSIINSQNGAYRVDDASGDGSHLSRLKAKEEKIYSNIVNNVIPGTRSIIDNLDYQITDALAKEALEAEQ